MPKKPREQQRFSFSDSPAHSETGKAEQADLPTTTSPAPGEVSSLPGDQRDPESLVGKSVWVVDAHNLIYQVFHAMPDMTSPSGMPVGAIHGFTRDILNLLENQHPDYLLCAFDHPGPTFRHTLYPRYKERRESMPDDLRTQITDIRRMLTAMGIPQLSVEDYEADDLMATVARQTRQRGGTCYLVTGDKDCWQLVGDQVKLFNIRKGQILDEVALEKQWGIRPDQVVDFQALVGDKVDDIPGVPLIGPKIAKELLLKFDHLQGIYENLDGVAGKKRRENLEQYREQATVSRKLVRLEDQAPLQIDWSQARVAAIPREPVAELCREFGFRRLTEQLTGAPEPQISTTKKTVQHAVATRAELEHFARQLRDAGQFSIQLETTVATRREAKVLCWGFSFRESEAHTVSVDAGSVDAGAGGLSLSDVVAELRGLLEDPAIGKGGHDIKRVLVALLGLDIHLQGLRFDTLVADYLLSPGERNHDLEDLAQRQLQYPLRAIPKSDVLDFDGSERRERCAERADIPFRLYRALEQRLADEGLDSLYRDVELPVTEVLAEMEFAGIRVDVAGLKQLSERFAVRLGELQGEILELAGQPFNIDSPRQLAEILFQKLGLPVVKRTPKNEPSTDASVLEELAARHELPAKIVEYRQLAKLKGTYVDALPLLVHPETGRVHTTFNQDVAATGRLSSRDPNLQNIPIRTEVGREIRRAFLPAEGWRLITADYSQIELRVLAHFSRDPALLDAFQRDEDIHAQVASQVFGVPLAEVPADLRRRAKAVNFGIIYGQTPFGLSKSLGISKEEAGDFMDAYFRTYPGVNEFIRQTLDQCRERGHVTTILGRRRSVDGVRSAERRQESSTRTLPERIAVNTVIQGSAADLIKLAMLRVHRRLRDESCRTRMLLQIHDELIFEAPPEERERVGSWIPEEMMAAAALEVPLKVDVKSGPNWGACDLDT